MAKNRTRPILTHKVVEITLVKRTIEHNGFGGACRKVRLKHSWFYQPPKAAANAEIFVAIPAIWNRWTLTYATLRGNMQPRWWNIDFCLRVSSSCRVDKIFTAVATDQIKCQEITVLPLNNLRVYYIAFALNPEGGDTMILRSKNKTIS